MLHIAIDSIPDPSVLASSPSKFVPSFPFCNPFDQYKTICCCLMRGMNAVAPDLAKGIGELTGFSSWLNLTWVGGVVVASVVFVLSLLQGG